MGEIERLQELLREANRLREEEQRRREAAEGRALEEQHQREEEQRRREEEQRRREEEQRRREEEQRRREEEQRRREEEQRRREEAEKLADASRPLTLQPYLETCHSLSLDIEILTDRSLTTQGDTTNPTGRIYPRRIIPWATFAREQEHVWDELSFSPSFSSQAVFPSRHQLDYVRSLLRPVSSEIGLRNSERDVVENAIQKLMDATYNDSSLRSHLGLDGTVTFESHTNLGITDDSLSESMEQVSISSRPSSRLTRRRRKARGKGNRADQFCIYRASDEQNIPAVAIEYKAPHKLRRDEIVTGLVSEIQPDRDVINQEGEGYAFAARRLTTAVVTQLFSYMIGKGIQYGYVCTGEAYIFLHIPDDPSCVYYSVCVPSLDVQDDDEARLHRTAVAQAFAFVLQAIRSPPPCQAWHDAAEDLDTWAVEYEDVLRSIPETDRKPRRETTYKAQRWKGFVRSPIRTRSRCLPPQDGAQQPSGDDSDDDDDESPSPTPNPGVSHGGASTTTSTGIGSSEMQGHDGNTASQEGTNVRPNIQDRLYCTHECLRGLAFGDPMDQKCPNLADHGNAHINRREFLQLARDQLAVDRGKDADCVPLYLSGSRGSLFKFCLSSHGYTLVAKGVEAMDAEHLLYENKIYSHLRDLQGKFVPVCLGVVDLIKPYYFNSGVYEDFMFLSYGGRPVLKGLREVNKNVVKEILIALGRLHQHGVLHRDAEPRNVLYDKDTGRYMIVDLMLAELHARQPLGPINVNRRNRKRKWAPGKHEKDVFDAEAQSLRASLTQ
ncbi:Protein kinase domain-containing protein [Fusarium falciforme]|uniref:Protein kinase domain-containing protein n=1 Tax=Fusarium falciforme TaxID=195108 RepID=UPI002301F0D8|nr:Protein kinase domain-containing protein [Fusarium falciforme]WAO93440.1 Protein kinase domain-containing protein [Fusarium falciforme]